ncbi:MAG: hypothetical protein M1828_001692 [Chrysothrix sp. TS-e1954]|nr:MAG: hypothetical protein M1828_001692 [Chrysothrix sp. TS-e1954]
MAFNRLVTASAFLTVIGLCYATPLSTSNKDQVLNITSRQPAGTFPEGAAKSFTYINGQDPNTGYYVQTCYTNSGDSERTVEYAYDDYNAVVCLLGLHASQSDTCITIGTSSCASPFGTPYNGHILNLRYVGSATDNGHSGTSRLSDDQANALSYAAILPEGYGGDDFQSYWVDDGNPPAGALSGISDTGGPYFLITDSTWTARPNYETWQVNWVGGQTC